MTRRRSRVAPLAGRHVRRRAGSPVSISLALSVSMIAVLALMVAVSASFLRHPERKLADAPVTRDLTPLATADSTGSASPSPSSSPSASASASTVSVGRAVIPSDRRRVVAQRTIKAGGSPKALAAAPSGQVAVFSMGSQVVVYDGSGRTVARVSAEVTPSRFGIGTGEQKLTGAPVDGAFSPDGGRLWVSNYAMAGPGYTHAGDDDCRSGSGLDKSFVYRVDTRRWAIDAVVGVGAVPKDVRITPDGRRVLVANWCSGELTVIDAAKATVIGAVPLGSHPRGIAVSPDSSTAYVALTGSRDVAVVDLDAVSGTSAAPVVRRLSGIGAGPRQVLLSPDGRRLYVTCLESGTVVALDPATGAVAGRVVTGKEPRTAVLSSDGSALFIVNYESSNVVRVRTSDLAVVERLAVPRHTIAVAYVLGANQLWVGQTDGLVRVFADQEAR